MADFRIEKDSLGPVEVPAGAYFGAQTERARQNFPVSGRRGQGRGAEGDEPAGDLRAGNPAEPVARATVLVHRSIDPERVPFDSKEQAVGKAGEQLGSSAALHHWICFGLP